MRKEGLGDFEAKNKQNIVHYVPVRKVIAQNIIFLFKCSVLNSTSLLHECAHSSAFAWNTQLHTLCCAYRASGLSNGAIRTVTIMI